MRLIRFEKVVVKQWNTQPNQHISRSTANKTESKHNSHNEAQTVATVAVQLCLY